MRKQLPVWQSIANPSYYFEGMPVLIYELNYETMCDDFDCNEVTAHDMFAIWANRLKKDDRYKNGLVDIHWFATIPGAAKFERVPFQYDHLAEIRSYPERHWLTAYDSDPINWLKCRIKDKRWRAPQNGESYGFIQDATGWKPSALQPFVFLPSLIYAAHNSV